MCLYRLRLGMGAMIFGLTVLIGPTLARAERVEIASLEALAAYAALDDNTVVMKPGTYEISDYLTQQRIDERIKSKNKAYITFSGRNNTFELEGVTIRVDTKLRKRMRHPRSTHEFVIQGDKNTLKGLAIECYNQGTSHGGVLLWVQGDGITLEDCAFTVTGSAPYGYGDLFGKGAKKTISHQKHSGVLFTGWDSRVLGCTIYVRSYGHGFVMQGGGRQHFEDCLVEGEMRSSDTILAETEGPAHKIDFKTVTRMRGGNHRVLPGYMKSLAEDGYRTYHQAEGLVFRNCVARHMRSAFELRTGGAVLLDGCAAYGNERGFWVGGNTTMTQCKADAKYGPLLFVEGEGSRVELEVLPDGSDRIVHALATIHGKGHHITLTPAKGRERSAPLPIMVGYTAPSAGEGMAPYGEKRAESIVIVNKTSNPVVLGDKANQIKP